MRFDYMDLRPKYQESSLAPCFREPLNQLRRALESIPNFQDSNFNRSTTIRDALRNGLQVESRWISDFISLDMIPRNIPNKNYVIDHIYDGECVNCQQRHRLQVEVCFDNRQAVGTNVFKFETAASFFEKKTGGKALSLVVCGARAALNAGGWDSGVADENEYQIAIDSAYSDYLRTDFSLLVMRI